MTSSEMREPAALARGATIELAVHVAVLGLVLLPLLAVVFPALLMLVATTMLSSSKASGIVATWLASAGGAPLASGFDIAIIAGLFGAFAAGGRAQAVPKLRDLSGSSGEKLAALISEIWRQLGGVGSRPTLRWFPTMDVAAYAAMPKNRPQVQLSAGLWQAAVANDPIARAILAHELAHLRYKDPLLLAVLDRLRAAIRSVLFLTAIIGLLVIAYVLVVETWAMLAADTGIAGLLGGWIRVMGAASVVLILLPLAWLALQRQIAFITSLIEMRADIVGAAYTEGLRHATQLFATHEGVARSGRREFWSALVSTRFTHIPEHQRLAILGSAELVITPKISFFAFSVALIFLLPINFASPLFLGGAANHMAMLAMAAAYNAALILMLIAGRSDDLVPISFKRMLALSLISIGVTALPRINLEPLSYLAMSWLAGFGGRAADWSSLPHDAAVTFHNLAGKFGEGLVNASALGAAIISLASLFLIIIAGRAAGWAPLLLRLFVALILTLTGTIIAGYDPFRAMPLPFIEDWLTAFAEAGISQSNLLCLPLLLPAIGDAAFTLIGVIIGTDRAPMLRAAPGPNAQGDRSAL